MDKREKIAYAKTHVVDFSVMAQDLGLTYEELVVNTLDTMMWFLSLGGMKELSDMSVEHMQLIRQIDLNQYRSKAILQHLKARKRHFESVGLTDNSGIEYIESLFVLIEQFKQMWFI